MPLLLLDGGVLGTRATTSCPFGVDRFTRNDFSILGVMYRAITCDEGNAPENTSTRRAEPDKERNYLAQCPSSKVIARRKHL